MSSRYWLALAAVAVCPLVTIAQSPTPADGPALVEPAAIEMAPVVEAAPAVVCCPIEVVSEKVTLSARKAYRCYGPGKPQVLCVDNPANCIDKLYSVPVCVPACCVGEPVCCGTKVGLLGRGYVTYRWPCGFEATIVFRVHGGVVIVYR